LSRLVAVADFVLVTVAVVDSMAVADSATAIVADSVAGAAAVTVADSGWSPTP
jgi:hypothetical protein